MMRRTIPGLMLILAGCQGAAADDKVSTAMPMEKLQSAHSAYVEQDYATMMRSMKDLLMEEDLDIAVKENVLQLYSQAQNSSCGEGLPMDWREPEGTRSLTLAQLRSNEPDGSYHKLKLSGRSAELDTITQVQIRKFGQEPIIDLSAGLGELYTEKEEGEADFYFDIDSGFKRIPHEDGLYLLTIETKTGASVDGWFILSDLLGSETANVLSPAVGEVMTTATPSFRWEQFQSPEYQPCERRRLVMHVTSLPQTDGWRPAVSLFKADPYLTSIAVGEDDPDLIGAKTLENGTYWFTLDYREEYKVGPLKMRRQMRTARDFSVRAP